MSAVVPTDQFHVVDWIEGDVPLSIEFGDTFYSRADGRAETRHTFIDGNDLKARWVDHNGIFNIAELGFGTGLNFVETWRQWRGSRSADAKLVFTSFEAYPLKATDARRALLRWPELKTTGEQLIANWVPTDCMRHVWQADTQTRLVVIVGDARETVPAWESAADCWMLDGFCPSKNPQLWDEGLLRDVYDHTNEGGTFATYSAASQVQKDLTKAGFSICKKPGFGRKREMLSGFKPP